MDKNKILLFCWLYSDEYIHFRSHPLELLWFSAIYDKPRSSNLYWVYMLYQYGMLWSVGWRLVEEESETREERAGQPQNYRSLRSEAFFDLCPHKFMRFYRTFFRSLLLFSVATTTTFFFFFFYLLCYYTIIAPRDCFPLSFVVTRSSHSTIFLSILYLH